MQVSIREMKNRLSKYLKLVQTGKEDLCEKLDFADPTERDQRTGVRDDDFSQTLQSPALDPQPGNV